MVEAKGLDGIGEGKEGRKEGRRLRDGGVVVCLAGGVWWVCMLEL